MACCPHGSRMRIRASTRRIDRRLVIGALTAIVAGLFPIREVAELVNIGTLSAFVVICLSVIVMRRTRPDAPRSFRTPLLALDAARRRRLLAVACSPSCPLVAWERFAIWMVLGLDLLFFLRP